MLPKGPYNPQEEEPKILIFWLDNKFYKPEYDPDKDKVVSFEEMLKDKRPTFCIINPPPNAYGRPHLGNVSGYAYQDLLLRYYRMKGYKVYGQPGKDHAGIQGEIVVLREYFRPQGKFKANMTRDEFYRETYEYFMKIKEQAKKDEQRIGLSSDFDRDVFTLDPEIVDIVLDTFIKLYRDGYVYKGVRIVNWCPSCQTALADIDTEPKERSTDFVYIKYPLIPEDANIFELKLPYADLDSLQKNKKLNIDLSLLGNQKNKIKINDFVILEASEPEYHKMRLPSLVANIKEDKVELKPLDSSFWQAKYPLLIGTSSKFKQGLFKSQLEDLGLKIITVDKPLEIREGETSLIENAKAKALAYSKAYPNALVIANDGGAEIPYLGKKWNKVLTKRLVGGDKASYKERAQALLELMKDVPKDKRTVYWEGAYAVALNGEILFAKSYKEEPGIITTKLHPGIEKSTGDWLGYIWYYPQLEKYSFELTDSDKVKLNWAIIQFKKDLLAFLFEKGIINYVTVATTRPETMLGDTAVVVNPDDIRYQALIGRKVLLPLVWRPIPIITDPIVDKNLGTGALKLTPAHAYEDYQIMLNWNKNTKKDPDAQIDYINVIDKQAKIVGPTGKYFGLSTTEAKEQVVKDLQALKLVSKIETKKQFVQVCERCKTVIEPQMSSQWFIDVSQIKKPAIEVVEKGEIKIHPKNMTKVYLDWMYNLRDWPISRSLWWGYRFPVWYKGKVEEKIDENGKVITYIDGTPVKDFKEAEEKGLAKISKKSPGKGWIQSDYVFDTWFSSGQWPFATLMKFKLFDKFYPTQVMETGYDILKWWVSRMVMLGLYRTGKIPFEHVYLHGLIKSFDGQKMSKSKGNVVYPHELIEKYGADVLRLFYIVGNKAGANYQITHDKLEGNKRFLNKLWNASKFVLFNIEEVKDKLPQLKPQELKLSADDKKMVKEVDKIAERVKKYIESFKFGIIAVDLRQHFWEIFCDWYLEIVKPRLYTKDKNGNPIEYDKDDRLAAQWTLYYALQKYLKILHPYIPFITERIWQEMPKGKGDHRSLMFSRWE